MSRVGERKSTRIHGVVPRSWGILWNMTSWWKDVDLLLFGPALVGCAVIAVLGFGAELAHQNGLLWKSPLHVVSIFGRAAVPADVLVDADDVEGIGEGIVQGGGAAFDVR